MSLSEFLKKYRSDHGLSMDDFARLCGLSKPYISMLEKNRNSKSGKAITPSIRTYGKIAHAVGLSVDSLMRMLNGNEMVSLTDTPTAPAKKPWEGLKNIVPPEDLEVRKVPLLGTIAAGKPIFSDEHIETMIPCNDSRIDFALQIQGDSMIDAEYYDGDIVFIHSQPMVDNGQIAAVRVDDSATLKRFYKENDSVTLMSANPLYPPMHFDASNCDEIAIIGIPVARYTEHTK